jgi:hypothetical protein
VFKRETRGVITGRVLLELGTTSEQLIVSTQDTLSTFCYLERDIRSMNIPHVSTYPKEALLYCLRSLVKLTLIRPSYGFNGINAISEDTRRIEMRITSDLATDFFELPSSQYTLAADGSACIAFRDISH